MSTQVGQPPPSVHTASQPLTPLPALMILRFGSGTPKATLAGACLLYLVGSVVWALDGERKAPLRAPTAAVFGYIRACEGGLGLRGDVVKGVPLSWELHVTQRVHQVVAAKTIAVRCDVGQGE